MKPVTSACVIFMTSWALVVQGRPKGSSTNRFDAVYLLSGVFDNSAQIAAGSTTHDYIEYRGVPVDIPDRIPGLVLFTEWAFNGAILHMQFNEVKEDKQGVVSLVMHYITGKEKYKPGEIKPENLHNLTTSETPNRRKCKATFKPVDKNIFQGNWPECKISINGKHPFYGVTLGCDAMKVTVHEAASEKFSLVPYDLRLKGPRYPLINAPAGYKPPCQRATDQV